MRTALFAAALAATLVPLHTAEGQWLSPDPKVPLITASGNAEVKLPPDFVVIRVGLITRGSSPGGAATDLDRLMVVVRDSLRARGLPDSSIVVGVREITPQGTGADQPITGYTAGVSLNVSLRELAKLGQVLDALAAAGASELPEVKYKSDHEDSAYAAALAKAVANATMRAEAAARAAGGRLGPITMMQVDGRSGGEFDFDVDVDFDRTEAPRAREAAATKEASVTIYWRFEGR